MGLLGLAVLAFIGAVGSVVYFPYLGTYLALALVLFGSFLMIISAMIRERNHPIQQLSPNDGMLLENEESSSAVA
jgi:hypothetical protein